MLPTIPSGTTIYQPNNKLFFIAVNKKVPFHSGLAISHMTLHSLCD